MLEEFRTEIDNFFRLPYEEKKKLWQQADNHEGFGQLFVVSEDQKLDWSDMFYITTLPLNLRKSDLFEKLPPKLRFLCTFSVVLNAVIRIIMQIMDLNLTSYLCCRNTLQSYSIEVKNLAIEILGHMAKSLKMDAEEMRELFSDGVQSMRMNYYPPCSEPDKAIGFTPHSDAVALTILSQLTETEGLQIRKDGRWVPVTPLQNAFVVNIGDIMEVLVFFFWMEIEHS